jgi:hypothetical protein
MLNLSYIRQYALDWACKAVGYLARNRTRMANMASLRYEYV